MNGFTVVNGYEIGVASNEMNIDDSFVVTVTTYGNVVVKIVVPSCAFVNRTLALVAFPATLNSIFDALIGVGVGVLGGLIGDGPVPDTS